MDDNKIEENKVLQGFNDGYIISKYEPGLADKLSRIEAVNPYLIGLQKGHEQYLKDQLKTKLPDWLKENPAPDKDKSPSKDKDLEMDKE